MLSFGDDYVCHSEKIRPSSSAFTVRPAVGSYEPAYPQQPVIDAEWPPLPPSSSSQPPSSFAAAATAAAAASFSPSHRRQPSDAIQGIVGAGSHGMDRHPPPAQEVLGDIAVIRKSFLLFVKILFKCIGDDLLLREHCKLAVYECRLTHEQEKLSWARLSAPTSSSQQYHHHHHQHHDHPCRYDPSKKWLASIQEQLRRIVGPNLWDQAKRHYDVYRRLIARKWGRGRDDAGVSFPIELSQLLRWGETIGSTFAFI